MGRISTKEDPFYESEHKHTMLYTGALIYNHITGSFPPSRFHVAPAVPRPLSPPSARLLFPSLPCLPCRPPSFPHLPDFCAGRFCIPPSLPIYIKYERARVGLGLRAFPVPTDGQEGRQHSVVDETSRAHLFVSASDSIELAAAFFFLVSETKQPECCKLSNGGQRAKNKLDEGTESSSHRVCF